MKGKTRNILLGVLVVGLITMTIAYASLSQRLNINGSAAVNGASNWNVKFTEVTTGKITKTGYAAVDTTATLVQTGATQVLTPQVTFKAPGDSVTFKFNVTNDGTINAKLSSFTTITIGNVTSSSSSDSSNLSTFKNQISASLTYADGTAIAVNDTLNAGQTKNLKLVLTFSSSATTLPVGTLTIPLVQSTMVYSQA